MSKELKTLSLFARNLTDKYKRTTDHPPIIGRELETRKLIEVLSQKFKNNAILVGEPGVGKSALTEGLAQALATDAVPESLKGKELWELDLALLSNKDESDGGFQVRLKRIVDEVEKTNGRIILFVDEAHTLVGTQAGPLDASNVLKPALARGVLRMIGATTNWEYHKYLEADKALTRRMITIRIEEPTEEQAIAILKGRKRSLEVYHGVQLDESAIEAAVRLSVRYLPARRLPDKAIDLLDQAAAAVRLSIDAMPQSLLLLKKELTLAYSQKELAKNKEEKQAIQQRINGLKPQVEFLTGHWKEQKAFLAKLTVFRKEVETAYQTLVLARKANESAEKLGLLEAKHQELEERLNAILTAYRDRPNVIIQDVVDKAAIQQAVVNLTGIPVSELTQSEADKLKRMEELLSKRIIGQKHAIKQVSYAIKRSRLGIGNPGEPIGSFLFLGSTGTGKSQPNYTVIPTPTGERFLGDLLPGDWVYNPVVGKKQRIIGVFPQGVLPVFVTKLADGRAIETNDEHLNQVFVDGVPSIITTKELRSLIKAGKKAFFKLTEPLEYADDNNSIDDKLINFLLEGEEALPSMVYTWNKRTRFLLAKRIIESFGYTTQGGTIQLELNSLEKANSVKKLLCSLGILTTAVSHNKANNAFSIELFLTDKRLKDLRLDGRVARLIKTSDDYAFVGVSSVYDSGKETHQLCIKVESDESLYVTNDYVVTHNTELVKALAEVLFGNEKAFKRFDCGELQHKNSINRLIGAPPGEDVNDQGGELTEWAKRNPYSVILFDEAEKAYPGVFDVLLSLLDDGELADSRGDVVDFTNCVIVFTSNLGAREVRMGFNEKTGGLEEHTLNAINALIRNPDPERGGRGFRPEFVNRLDDPIIFYPLTRQDNEGIANLKLKALKKRLYANRQLRIVYGQKGYETLKDDQPPKLDVAYWLAYYALKSEDLPMGGRPINRLIKTELEDKLVDLFLEEAVPDGSYLLVKAGYDPNKPRFYRGDDGEQRPTPPVLQLQLITKEEYEYLIQFDPTE